MWSSGKRSWYKRGRCTWRRDALSQLSMFHPDQKKYKCQSTIIWGQAFIRGHQFVLGSATSLTRISGQNTFVSYSSSSGVMILVLGRNR